MAVLPIITAPDPRLKQISARVPIVDDKIRRLLDDMLETMYAAPGIGLAAIQVGIPKRLLVIDVTPDGSKPAPLKIINPEVTWVSDEDRVCEEGCLSLPEQFAEIVRPAALDISYLDAEGMPRNLRADGLLAVCLQHEMDHLDGCLFVDHLSSVRRNMILRRLLKRRRAVS